MRERAGSSVFIFNLGNNLVSNELKLTSLAMFHLKLLTHSDLKEKVYLKIDFPALLR